MNGTGTVSTFNVSAPGTATVGTAFNVTITAADPYGNGTTATRVRRRLVLRPLELAQWARADLPGSVTFTNGVGTANITLFDAQTTTLTATQGALTGTSNSYHGQREQGARGLFGPNPGPRLPAPRST